MPGYGLRGVCAMTSSKSQRVSLFASIFIVFLSILYESNLSFLKLTVQQTGVYTYNMIDISVS